MSQKNLDKIIGVTASPEDSKTKNGSELVGSLVSLKCGDTTHLGVIDGFFFLYVVAFDDGGVYYYTREELQSVFGI